ncbi:MAG: s23 ribosomal protein [Parcubacteria group bacterium LiPW_30]|nr:MAG: s23 ribosomal protein [Parcubacteria group bacterium LiPW_30]
MLHSYKDLIVWQRGMELTVKVYELTEKFPKEEIYGLISQIRRASSSIPANIAEGRFRGSKKEFLQFLRIAYASGAELESHIELSKRLPKTKNLKYGEVDSLLTEVMKMLNTIIRKLNPKEAIEAEN